jgi:Protein of unknown function (DUF3617)
MRNMNYLILAVSTCALISCSASTDPNKREPGKWKTVATLENLELTGVPAGMEAQVARMKEQMAAQVKSAGSRDECLTAEQSAKEDISKGLSQGAGGACKFSKQTIGGGKIDVAGTCSQGGQEMDLVMAGTMSSKNIDVLMTMSSKAKTDGPMNMPGMNMKLRMVGTHEGKCEA